MGYPNAIAAIFALSVLACGCPVIRARLHFYEHLERMRTLELSQPERILESMEHRHYIARMFWLAFALGVLPSMTAFGAASIVTLRMPEQPGVAMTAWITSSIASVAATVCAVVVIARVQPRP